MSRCVSVYTTVSAAYTATSEDCVIFVDASGGILTITLPDTTNLGGKLFTFVKVDATGNDVTIDGNGNTINSGSSHILSVQWDRLKIICDGSNWVILNT